MAAEEKQMDKPILKKTVIKREDKIPLEESNKRLFVIGIVFSAVILVTTGVLVYLRFTLPESEIKEIVTQVEEITQANREVETVVEIQQLDREDISLEILNGSGIAGVAGKSTTVFEELGYTVDITGNADIGEGNKLFVDLEVASQVDKLLEDVKEELGITSITGDLNDSDSTARIILGQ